MKYETDKIILTPLTRKHLETAEYRCWWDDPKANQYNSHGLFPLTEKEKAEFIESFESGRDLVWAIYYKHDPKQNVNEYRKEMGLIPIKDGGRRYRFNPLKEEHIKYIGNVALQQINWISRSAELAILIGESEYWSKGIATSICKLVLIHGFKKLNLHRVYLGTAATNIGMIKIAEKIGMSAEGVSKEAMFLNGKYEDIYHFGILENE